MSGFETLGIAQSCLALIRLAEEAKSKRQYYDDALGFVAGVCGAVYGHLYFIQGAESVSKRWSDGTVDPEFFGDMVQDFLSDALVCGGMSIRVFNAKPINLLMTGIAVPLEETTSTQTGGIAMLLPCDEAEANDRLGMLFLMARFIHQASFSVGLSSSRVDATTGGVQSNKAMRNVANYSSKHELAFGLVNQLKTKTGSNLIALGEVKSNKISILCISGFDSVKKRSPGVRQIQQAMEECLDYGDDILYQTQREFDDGEIEADFRLHRQWHESSGGDAVASFPLEGDSGIEYVMSLRRDPDQVFKHSELAQLRDTVEPYCPVLSVVERASWSVGRHLQTQVGASVADVVAPRSWGRKIVYAAMLAGFLWFAFGVKQYEIVVPCIVSPAETRQLSAPNQGVIKEIFVRPGDRVKRGDLLAKFDDSELQIGRRAFVQDIKSAELEILKAMASKDRVELQFARATKKSLQQELESIEFRIEQTAVRASFDGTIVGDSMQQRIGDVVERGQPLMTLATSSGWRLDLQVPESDIAHMLPGMKGAFVPLARPDQEGPLVLKRVAPSTTRYNDQNVFVFDAGLTEQPDWLRAGMEGVAKVEVGSQRVWWITLHKTINWFRLKAWM